MKSITKLILLIFVLPNILALELSEVEPNPPGADTGNEWIELYSEQEVNLESYFLENNDGKTRSLNGSFTSYLVVSFDSQWLDNSDEKVILKKGDEIIDETILLKDDKNNDFSWNKCEGGWLFIESTKEGENNCVGEKQQAEEISEDIAESGRDKKTSHLAEQINQSENKNFQVVSDASEKITLNSPAGQSSQPFASKQEKNRTGIIYAFTIFTVIIIILLALRKL